MVGLEIECCKGNGDGRAEDKMRELIGGEIWRSGSFMVLILTKAVKCAIMRVCSVFALEKWRLGATTHIKNDLKGVAKCHERQERT